MWSPTALADSAEVALATKATQPWPPLDFGRRRAKAARTDVGVMQMGSFLDFAPYDPALALLGSTSPRLRYSNSEVIFQD